MNKEERQASAHLSRLLIKETGVDFLAKVSGRSVPAVYRWQVAGMPPYLEQLLRLRFPGLRALGGRGVPGVTREED